MKKEYVSYSVMDIKKGLRIRLCNLLYEKTMQFANLWEWVSILW